MAIVVLVLWLFTAGAGFSVLITSNLKGDDPVPAPQFPFAPAHAAEPAAAQSASASGSAPPSVSRREAKRILEDQIAPPSLVAARNAPVVPGARALLEFAHPAFGIIGLAFWLGFSLVHYRVLGWIGFGLAAATAGAGLTWFTVNVRAARRPDLDERAPSFRGRLVAVHGGGAALTVVLAALSALVLRA
ncbi:MAG TPA: hypothetical protein VHO07_08740 [Streptosporangiaceae bacterium]|jgi:hypothetical protein|nr:hypothetical protein [Streptosporangiaceae bacterium]